MHTLADRGLTTLFSWKALVTRKTVEPRFRLLRVSGPGSEPAVRILTDEASRRPQARCPELGVGHRAHPSPVLSLGIRPAHPESQPRGVSPHLQPHPLAASAARHLAEPSVALAGKPRASSQPRRVHATCFSFALADLLPQPVCLPQMCALPWSRSLPSRAQGQPGAGAARWPCTGRLRRRMGHRLVLPCLPPHPGCGDRAPCGESQAEPPGLSACPTHSDPVGTRGDASGAVSEAEGGVALCPGVPSTVPAVGWEWPRPRVRGRS